MTGNGWTFPIEKARVVIRLPAGASILQHAEYTGYQGSKAADARVTSSQGGLYEAETTRRLEANEGFTVAVGWQKGIVAPPSGSQQWGWWIGDNAGYFALGLGLLFSAGYFCFAWNRVGRDPEKGTIIPLFAPPQGLGPAAARYVTRYNFDDKGFAAALVGLAVKGGLKIADDEKSFTVTKLAHAPAACADGIGARALCGTASGQHGAEASEPREGGERPAGAGQRAEAGI